jgi:hypothetical protein
VSAARFRDTERESAGVGLIYIFFFPLHFNSRAEELEAPVKTKKASNFDLNGKDGCTTVLHTHFWQIPPAFVQHYALLCGCGPASARDLS